MHLLGSRSSWFVLCVWRFSTGVIDRGDVIASGLNICDSGPRFVVRPHLCRFILWDLSNARILHDHARTGIPSQNGIVVSGCRKIHGLLILIHCVPQRMICGGAGSRAAMVNACMSHALPDDALVVGPLVVALDSC